MVITGTVRPRGFTLCELMLVLGAGTLVLAMMLPAIGRARIESLRRQSKYNSGTTAPVVGSETCMRDDLTRLQPGQAHARLSNESVPSAHFGRMYST
jgi:hypothetical protein